VSQAAIREILNTLRFPFTVQQLKTLAALVDLLYKWNKTYNLIGTQNIDEIITRHIGDSLAIIEYLQGKRIIDVGTGAGFPGIPLAIMQPQKQFVLLDSNGKKIRFIKQAIVELKLHNITAVNARAEDFCTGSCFDSVLTRAFASICDMLKVTQHLACMDGYFLAMKGMQPTEELQALPDGFCLDIIHALNVPNLEAARCLVMIKRDHEKK